MNTERKFKTETPRPDPEQVAGTTPWDSAEFLTDGEVIIEYLT